MTNEITLKDIEGLKTVKVKPFGNGSAHVTLPKSWVGHTVQVVLLKDDD